MREILFRGKTHKGEWVYGVPAKNDFNETFIVQGLFECDEYSCNGADCFDIDGNTIGQYTGLTDKNGTKIFEGDIIQFDYIGKNLGVNGIETVVFKNGKFGVIWGTHRELVCLDGFANTTLEVIGNIHDNPELLKEREG